MEFPITYIILLIWLIMIIKFTDNYVRLGVSIFGIVIGLNLMYNDAWLIFKYDFVDTYTYNAIVNTQINTITRAYTITNQIINISNIFDFYFGLMLVFTSLGIAFTLINGMSSGRDVK